MSTPGDQPFAFSLFSKHCPPFTSVYHMKNCVLMQSKEGIKLPICFKCIFSPVLFSDLLLFFLMPW